MSQERVPPAVRRFLEGHLRSVEELETLILLFRGDDEWWSAERLADELGISKLAAIGALEALAARSLLDVRLAERVVFRYKPVSEETDAAVRALEETYGLHRAAVAALIYGPRLEDARAFAEAFRIRKGDRRG